MKTEKWRKLGRYFPGKLVKKIPATKEKTAYKFFHARYFTLKTEGIKKYLPTARNCHSNRKRDIQNTVSYATNNRGLGTGYRSASLKKQYLHKPINQ